MSDWNVTVTNQSDPDAGGEVAQGIGCQPSFPLVCDGGSLTTEIWSGDDQLLIQGNGVGTVGTFSGQVTAPLDVDGLNPDLFSPDGGTVPLGHDLTLTWTPGGAASVTINAEDGQTLGMIICTVPDNGSFTIPSAALSNFQSGDQGGLAVFRSVESCAHSDDASISILLQTETWGRVVFQ